MFWSGETLLERLEALIEPFSPGRVDCAAYTLAIGPEVYVSPNDQTADPTTVTVRKLGEHNPCTAAKPPLQRDCAVCFKPQNCDVCPLRVRAALVVAIINQNQ